MPIGCGRKLRECQELIHELTLLQNRGFDLC
jgi:hypothetical protein